MMDAALQAALLTLEPERAHAVALQLLATAGATEPGRRALRFLYGPAQERGVELAGLRFPNRVGLAAGYDKDARAWKAFAALGCGHVEVGTVTPRPQPGNPHPRVFRLRDQRAVINRMGFPSQGARVVRARLDADRPYGTVLGVNIGKNKDTPLEEASRDYVELVEVFGDVADYLTVNVSSPNTPQLRELQRGPALRALLAEVVRARDAEVARRGRALPVFVKLAPDLDDADLDDALGAVDDSGLDGIVATNTTISREGVTGRLAQETGGLSGAPLTQRALTLIRTIRARARADLPLIGVGGIMTTEDARARLDAGADLVQVYTGLVYRGAGFVRAVAEET
ncbi:MAG: quinone-dependent dihydroorotate dehydrogenase [Alphaproteobacteria bacterium]|nr:quinone-dependent dihydroorotate dehydrogenase [Alphaproteobacteria bacterium]